MLKKIENWFFLCSSDFALLNHKRTHQVSHVRRLKKNLKERTFISRRHTSTLWQDRLVLLCVQCCVDCCDCKCAYTCNGRALVNCAARSLTMLWITSFSYSPETHLTLASAFFFFATFPCFLIRAGVSIHTREKEKNRAYVQFVCCFLLQGVLRVLTNNVLSHSR